MRLTKHEHLDYKIWATDNNLNIDVADMLWTVVWDFIDYVRSKHNMGIRNQDVKDVLLFGSITNYFYDKKSDIDMCIVLDIETIKRQFPNLNILQTLKLYYYDWAMLRHCSIYGRKLDLNFADVNDPLYNDRYRSGPNYSILKKDWIFKPVAISDQEFEDIKKQGIKIYKQILQEYKIVKHNGFQIQDMETFFKRLMSYKKIVHHINFEQNITPMYIAFHNVKRHGILKKLHEKMMQKQTKNFTLK